VDLDDVECIDPRTNVMINDGVILRIWPQMHTLLMVVIHVLPLPMNMQKPTHG